ncbi:MAG: hypothetical protein KDA79_06130, partial [Planctomycetaceae bacterium]|nr:hypothetical protein [Planctomycetaceae bacterium]
MRTCLAICAVLIPLVSPAEAQIRSFPYQATIAVEQAEVRSGPGSRYYATARLPRGQQIVIHRHDPGGWYMISPPQGSFSWVEASHVQRGEGSSGTVTANDVPVWIGSSETESFDVEQVRLGRNARVTILESRTVQQGGKSVEMLAIAPPRGEFRWIAGQAVVPVAPQLREQHDLDPFATPTTAMRENVPAAAGGPALAAPARRDSQVRTVSVSSGESTASGSATPRVVAEGVSQHGLRPEQILSERQRLRELDGKFRQMIQLDPAEWNFQQIEADYRRLQQSTEYGVLASQIELRLASLKHYQGIRREYDEFLEVTSETSQRDAELAARQQQIALGGFDGSAAARQQSGFSVTPTDMQPAPTGPTALPFPGEQSFPTGVIEEVPAGSPVEVPFTAPETAVEGDGSPFIVPSESGPILTVPSFPETSSTTPTSSAPELAVSQPIQPVADPGPGSGAAAGSSQGMVVPAGSSVPNTLSFPADAGVQAVPGVSPAAGNANSSGIQPVSGSGQPVPTLQSQPATQPATAPAGYPQPVNVPQPAGVPVPALQPVPGQQQVVPAGQAGPPARYMPRYYGVRRPGVPAQQQMQQ